MNKRRSEARDFARGLARSPHASGGAVELFVIPPFTAVADVASALADGRVRVGVQNIHWAEAGAWTGEISAAMAVDCGASIAEIGHSERREYFGETDETAGWKVAAALRHGMIPLLCIGDTREQHARGCTADALDRQLRAALAEVAPYAAARVVIAYEPVWAIGERGTPAEPAFADEQHARIKATFHALTGHEARVLYGGSVDRANCVAFARQPHVDGLFIGRSAWTLDGFLAIVQAVVSADSQAAARDAQAQD